jgi:hypothetical protein
MAAIELDNDDRAALTELLKRMIAADPFSMSPRVGTLRAIVVKLEAAPARLSSPASIQDAAVLPHRLDGAFERVYRADKHFADLAPRIVELKREQENGVIAHLQSNGLRDGVHIDLRMRASMTIAILVGEICYNLRTALEYLVFELAKLDTGTDQDGTQFPIVDTPEDFARRVKIWLKGINPRHVAAIERLQPYRGCEWTRALRNASNRDKHREFVRLVGFAPVTVYTARTDPNFPSLALPVFRAKDPVTGDEVDAKVDLQTTLSFDDGAPIIETLKEIKLSITETLEFFNRSSSSTGFDILGPVGNQPPPKKIKRTAIFAIQPQRWVG